MGRWTKKSVHTTLTSVESGFRTWAREADLGWGVGSSSHSNASPVSMSEPFEMKVKVLVTLMSDSLQPP